jgi:hypothetical protein
MDKKDPLKYGFLMLAFLQPDGHKQLQFGPSASQRQQNWEDKGKKTVSLKSTAEKAN